MIGHEALAPILARIPGDPSGVGRFVVAIAGPPAAGKSTLTASLLEALGGRAGVVAMDGFHFDNDILDARGHRDRKGAPHTFDVTAFGTTLGALSADRSVVQLDLDNVGLRPEEKAAVIAFLVCLLPALPAILAIVIAASTLATLLWSFALDAYRLLLATKPPDSEQTGPNPP